MEEILHTCCGLDVHRDSITACVMVGNGTQKRIHIREFPTFTQDIRELLKWLKSFNVCDVAIESTGIYWRPIFNIMEEEVNVILVNPAHTKNVPGRKTDTKDSEWLCRLLKCGLLSKSFIPPKQVVRLRELVRYRQNLCRDLSSAKNRIIKALERANIKLSTVFSDVFGVSCWGIVTKLIKGETRRDHLMAYIDPRVRASRSDICKALDGTLEEADRRILELKMKHIQSIESLIEEVECDIRQHLVPYLAEVNLLKTIPGVKDISAAAIIAEIGVDMKQFRDGSHLAAWSGMCPGNNESAGKIKSSRIRKGNKQLKTALTQVAWAVSRTKQTYLGAKYRALAHRRGKKRAIIAIGRKVLVICYHILSAKVPFHELGVDFLDKLEPERKVNYYTKRLEELGFHVELKEKSA